MSLAEIGDQGKRDLWPLADDHLFNIGNDPGRRGRHVEPARFLLDLVIADFRFGHLLNQKNLLP